MTISDLRPWKKKETILSAELPGTKPEDGEISIEKKIRTISGVKREDRGKRHRVEHSFGSFARRASLPTDLEEARGETSLQEGLLKFILLKSKTAQENVKRIPLNTE